MKKMKILTLIVMFTLILGSTLTAAEKGKAYMGVYLDDVSSSYYSKIGMDDNYGILISKVVSESPADEAGLEAKDILMEIDGDKIYTHDQLTKMLKNYEPGQKVKMKFFRDGKVKNIKFEFGKKEVPKLKRKAYMGVYLQELSKKYKQKLNYEKNYGIVITDLVEDGAAEKAGIKENAILMEIDGDKIYTIDQLTKMLTNYEPDNKIEVVVFQDEKEVKLDMILGEKAKISNFGWNWGDFNLSYEKPENVFVYQYSPENDKWIGVMLHIVEDTKNDVKKVTVTIDEVIEDTPAEDCGLQAGDIILAVDGKEINSKKTVSEIINAKDAGDKVDIKIDRKGKIINVQCEIALRQDHERYEKLELSLDDGEVSVWVDGVEKNLSDLYILQDELKDLEYLRKEEMQEAVQEAMEEAKEGMEELKELQELEIHFGQGGAI